MANPSRTTAADNLARLLGTRRQTAPAAARRLLLRVAEDADAPERLLALAKEASANEPMESIRRADLLIAVAEAREEPEWIAQARRVRTGALLALGRFADALAEAESTVAQARLLGDDRLAAEAQMGAVDALGRGGRLQEAEALGETLTRELFGTGADESAAKVLVNRGILAFRQDQHERALLLYGQAEVVFAASGDDVSLARVRVNAANSLTALNRVDEAAEQFESARAVFEQNGMTVFAATVDTNLGYLRFCSGQYTLALRLLDRARATFTGIGDDEGCAQCDLDSAEAYRALNLHPEALTAYERAVYQFAKLDAAYDLARGKVGLATVLGQLGRDAEASAALAEAESLFRRERNGARRAHTQLARAHLHHAAGEWTEATQMAQRAARGFRQATLTIWVAEARWIQADIALAQGGVGIRQMRAVARTARQQGQTSLLSRAEQSLARREARLSNTGAALRHYRASVAAVESLRSQIGPEDLRTAFLRDKTTPYEEAIALLLGRGDQRSVAEALELVEQAKSRLLLERILTAAEMREVAPDDAPLGEARLRLANLRAELSREYRAATAVPGEERLVAPNAPESLIHLEQEYRDALNRAELSDMSEYPSRSSARVSSAEQIRGVLGDDENLIEYFVADGYVCAFIVSTHRIEARAKLSPVAAVAAAARRLRYHLQKVATLRSYAARYPDSLLAEAREVLHELYRLLLAPLAPDLRGSRLTIVPHGLLHNLPFHAFFDGVGYALDRWEFLYAPSASLWRATNFPVPDTEGWDSPRDPPLLIGVPSPALPHITGEIDTLANRMPGATRLIGKNATSMAHFRRCAPQASLIHIATHARFRADNPLFSGLQLDDGWLLARDLYDMRLRCGLTTLSACRTGLVVSGAGDEIMGLVRGFLAAGSRSVAASLWSVDDGATAELMANFYSFLGAGRTGVSKAAALREAQRETRSRYAHPYYWGAFVLVGER